MNTLLRYFAGGFICYACACSLSRAAVTNYVDVNNGQHISPYTNWTDAATNIQAAVDVAGESDTVLVAAGTYSVGATNMPGISCLNRILITENITVISESGPAETFIVGAPDPTTSSNGPSAVRCIYMTAGTLSGFTVTNGYTQNAGFYKNGGGGGICHEYGGTSFVTNCIILDNSAHTLGGGSCYGSLHHCILSGNRSENGDGGGSYYDILVRCELSNNYASGNGGGCSDSILTNCVLIGNESGNFGGGSYGSKLVHCTLRENTAYEAGGGSHSDELKACIIFENEIVYTNGLGTNVFNQSSAIYSCSPDLEDGTVHSNRTFNPLFYPSGYVIHTNSPCVDFIDTNEIYVANDINGKSRPLDGNNDDISLSDIGAYEYPHPDADSDGDGMPDGWEEGFGLNLGKDDRFEDPDGDFLNNTNEYKWGTSPLNPDHDGDHVLDGVEVLEEYGWGRSPTNANNYIRYVNATGTPDPYAQYITPDTAATNVQDAINVTISNDTVIVTDGTYSFGGLAVNGHVNRIALTNNITLIAANGPKFTIIDGLGAVRCAYVTGGSSLSGFTLRNGIADSGGGIWMDGDSISNCIVVGNSATNGNGGGIYALNDCTVHACDFVENEAHTGNGGGIYLFQGGMLDEDCSFTNNSAGTDGGGIYCSGTLTALSNTIVSNYSGLDGGGIWAEEGVFSGCRLVGNTATNGSGGGIYCLSNGAVQACSIVSNSSAFAGGGLFSGHGTTVKSCEMIDNSALTGNGGAVYFDQGEMLSNCTFVGNSATNGGGIYFNLSGTLRNCVLSNNAAINDGGGIYCSGSSEVKACVITDNTADDGGGAYCYQGGTLENCLLSGNTAYDHGGGILCNNGGALQNCTISDNTASNRGGGVVCYWGGTLQNTIIRGNTAPEGTEWTNYYSGMSFTYCCTYPDPGGAGNITNAPLFAQNSYRIQSGSSCIDTGVDVGVMDDIENVPRPLDGDNSGTALPDIGAYEYAGWEADSDGDGLSDYEEVKIYHTEPLDPDMDGDGMLDGPEVAGGLDPKVPDITEIHYADAGNSTPLYPYITWETAATTLQDAVDAAASNDTVLVENGFYDAGGATLNTMSNRVVLTKPITVESVSGPEHTVIVGDGLTNGPSAMRCVHIGGGARLVGFTLAAGRTRLSGDEAWERSGGGIYLDDGSVSNCIISGNLADNDGGGIFCSGSGTVEASIVRLNSANDTGGGVRCNYGGIFRNCLFDSNSANHGGGAYCREGGSFDNCTFSGNAAESNAGGVRCYNGGSFTNCIIWGNSSESGADNWDNIGNRSYAYCCTAPPPEGQGNIDDDPLFWSADNYHLQTNSLCINAGTNLAWMEGAADLDGRSRSLGGRVDIGAYELDVGDADSDGLTNAEEGAWETGPYDPDHDRDGWLDGWEVDLGYSPVNYNYDTHYVDAGNHTPVYPYITTNTAAAIIQDAVNAASSNDTVRVNDGIYNAGRTEDPYSMSTRVVVSKTIFIQSENGPEHTLIVGAGPLGSAAVRCAYITNSAVLSGFTLTNGYTTAWRHGGGVYLEDGTLSGCSVRGNAAGRDGGGVYCGQNGLLEGCMLDGNTAGDDGGGVFLDGGMISNCIVSLNSTGADGGGIYCNQDSLLVNSLLQGNTATNDGGGVYCNDGGTLINCTLRGNLAYHGGGVYCYNGGLLENCIIWGNSASGYGNNLRNDGSGMSYINCCTPSNPGGTGNITSDPGFIAEFDCRLQTNSPCIDSGTNLAWMTEAKDLDGHERRNGDVDMGAYEYDPDLTDSDSDGLSDSEEGHWGTDPLDPDHDNDGWLDGWEVAHINAQYNPTNYNNDVHYVDMNSSGPVYPYTNWAMAATTIQAAIDAASSNDTVLVMDGFYDTGGTEDPHSMSNRVVLAKSVLVRSVNGPGSTFIAGDGPSGASAMRCAYVTNGAVLAGFTLTDGHTRNTGDTFFEQSGGGAFLEGGSISNCIISGNSATIDGGGAYLSQDGLLVNCLLESNSATDDGGGAFCRNGGMLDNCTLADNLSGDDGGGVYCREGGTIENCIVWDNMAAGSGNNWHNRLSGMVYTYCCTAPDPGGVGNITDNPLFMAAADYHLQTGSLCIDAGLTRSWMTAATDLDGHTRTVNGIVDIGAYEHDAGLLDADNDGLTTDEERVYGTDPLIADTDGDGISDGWEVAHVNSGYNPTNYNCTEIHYVDGDNDTPEFPYISWGTAATTIQEAIDAAVSNDTILVADGNYFNGRSTDPYSMDNRVVLTKAVHVQSVNGPDNTFIVGKGLLGGDAVRCAYVTNGASLTGFALVNGYTRNSGNTIREQSGGGVFLDGGAITNCVVRNCEATLDGGGVYCFQTGSLVNCLLYNNSAGDEGGGVYCRGGGTLQNCTLSDNSAVDYGGGLFCREGGELVNCIVRNNTAGGSGDNWRNSGSGMSYNYCCIQPNPGGTGNILSDPLFVDAGDYHLSSNSPCIDTGITISGIVADVERVPRSLDGDASGDAEHDIGAYEYVNPNADSDGDGLFDMDEMNVHDTHPLHFDTDNDGLPDGDEVNIHGTDPLNPDCDGDGLLDGNEVSEGTNPYEPDSDGDGISDNDEVSLYGTNPLLPDTDADGLPDHWEVHNPGWSATNGEDTVEHYVNCSNNVPEYPYVTWDTAASNIQDAVNVAVSGDIVLVTNGIYSTGGAVTPGYASSNRVVIAKEIDVESVNGPEVTTIMGLFDPDTGGHGNNAVRGVFMSAGTLSGFTVSNGHTKASGNIRYDCSGGGINLYGGTGFVSGCIISGNSAQALGGGSYCGMLSYCIVSENSAAGGGGSYYGTLYNCLLSANWAAGSGGGSYGAALIHCTLPGNWAHSGGGCHGSVLMNCIVWGNAAGSDGQDLHACTAAYSCSSGLVEGSDGNISGDPLFVDAAADDYHLMASSPGINSGTNLHWVTDDIEGVQRDAFPDMGAYEFWILNPDTDGDGIPDDWEDYFGLDSTNPDDASKNPDNDPFSNYEEYIADTDPLNSNDWFHIWSMSIEPMSVGFNYSTARQYTLLFSTNLLEETWLYVPGQTDDIGVGGEYYLTDPEAANPACFYKVEVGIPE